MEETAIKRKSARISALPDTMKGRKLNYEELDELLENEENGDLKVGDEASSGSESEPGSKKKRKIKPVNEVPEKADVKGKGILTEEAQQYMHDKPESKTENHPRINAVYVRRSAKPAAPEVPNKQILKLVIDALQRKDPHQIFALPVDIEEVEGYKDIVLNPMDFFTLKEKLEDGAYKSLEDFESETFLVFSNAMLFNPQDTIFYRQARKLDAYAKTIFHDLRTDPDNFESKYSLSRKRPGRKPKCEAKSTIQTVPSSSNPTVPHSSTQTVPRSSTHTKPRSMNHTKPRSSIGTRDVPGSNACGTRHTYMPHESYQSENESLVSEYATCMKTLVPVRQEMGYRESLSKFAEGMGPVVQRVVAEKLENCQVSASAPTPVPTSRGPLDNSAPINRIRDLNLPAEGMTESGSFLSLRVDSSNSDSKSSVASQGRLLGIGNPSLTRNNSSGSSSLPFLQTNNSSGSGLLPFPARTALIPNQVPSSSVPGPEIQYQGMVPQWQRYRESSAQQTSNILYDLNIPSLHLRQSLYGGNQVQFPSYASVSAAQAGLAMEGRHQTTQAEPIFQVYPSVGVLNFRNTASSSTHPAAVQSEGGYFTQTRLYLEHASLGQHQDRFGLFPRSNGSTSSSSQTNAGEGNQMAGTSQLPGSRGGPWNSHWRRLG